MDNPKSSFWGNVSYVGPAAKNKEFFRVAVASREFLVKKTDPAVAHLRVTSGSKKVFVIIEALSVEGSYRVVAVFTRINLAQLRNLQDLLQEGALTDKIIADELPVYQINRSLAWM